MVHFGGRNKKKIPSLSSPSNMGNNSNEGVMVGTPKKQHTTTSTGSSFFRTPNNHQKLNTTLPNTPEPAVAAVATTTTNPKNNNNKERPTINTIHVPVVTTTTTTLTSPMVSSTTNSNTIMNRIDSGVSDLSIGTNLHHQTTMSPIPIPAAVTKTNMITTMEEDEDHHHMIRINSIEATGTRASTSATNSSTSNGNSSNHHHTDTNDHQNTSTTTTAESIVTKVLGIVDMSCVSSGLVPSSSYDKTLDQPQHPIVVVDKSQPRDIRQSLSFQPEWGVAPRADDENDDHHNEEDKSIPSSSSKGSGSYNSHSQNNQNVKRDLANIVTRISKQNTTNHHTPTTTRRHETFELVYKEPTTTTTTSSTTKRNKQTTTTTTTTSSPPSKTNQQQHHSKQMKGLYINRWIHHQQKLRKQKKQQQLQRIQNKVSTTTSKYDNREDEDGARLGIMARPVHTKPSAAVLNNRNTTTTSSSIPNMIPTSTTTVSNTSISEQRNHHQDTSVIQQDPSTMIQPNNTPLSLPPQVVSTMDHQYNPSDQSSMILDEGIETSDFMNDRNTMNSNSKNNISDKKKSPWNHIQKRFSAKFHNSTNDQHVKQLHVPPVQQQQKQQLSVVGSSLSNNNNHKTMTVDDTTTLKTTPTPTAVVNDIHDTRNDTTNPKIIVSDVQNTNVTNLNHNPTNNNSSRKEVVGTASSSSNVGGGGNGTSSTTPIRKLLQSIKNSKHGLETVKEEDVGMMIHGDDDMKDTHEFTVRVPGVNKNQTDSYLRDVDLIGSEIVEEIYTSLDNYIQQQEEQAHDHDGTMKDNIMTKTLKDEVVVTSTTVVKSLPTSNGDTVAKTSVQDQTYNIVKDNMNVTQVLKNTVDEIIPPMNPKNNTNHGYQELDNSNNTTSDLKNDIQEITVAASPKVVLTPTKPKSWKERFGLKKEKDMSKANDTKNTPAIHANGDTTTNHRTQTTKSSLSLLSSPKKVNTSSSNSNNNNSASSKPQWKTAIDPDTGNTYYYHKKTRETTWTKPPDSDIIQPKTSNTANNKTVTVPTNTNEPLDGNSVSLKSNNITNDKKLQPTDHTIKIPNDDALSSMEHDLVPSTKAQASNSYVTQQDDNNTNIEQYGLMSYDQDYVDMKPFDEPIVLMDFPDDEKKKADEKSLSTARTRTGASIYSGLSKFSQKSRISEQTQPIKNLSSDKPNLNVIHDMGSHTTSLSSKHGVLPAVHEATTRSRRQARIPKNIPVPRLRELNVEEFTTTDRVFGSRISRHPKINRFGGTDISPDPTNMKHHDLGDIEDTDADKSTISYAATDSISALSEPDLSIVDRKEAYDDARRRALDRAIAQEDWDLAAKLSESMRLTVKSTNVGEVNGTVNRTVPQEWAQSEMDRFVSENDWDAVALYIAKVRANVNKSFVPGDSAAENHAQTRMMGVIRPSSDISSGTNNPQKRFGARSQLQHRDLNSLDSHSSYSTTFDSEYTSESYEQRSDDERPAAPMNRPRQQEFAC